MFPLYIGIFLVSLSTLLIEISLTRIFSVTIWYHFAFMVISIALLGFGASGSFLTVFRQIVNKDTNKVTALLAFLFAMTCIISLIIISRITLDPFQMAEHPVHIAKLFAYYLILIVPFFMSGLCISFLLSKMPHRVGTFYFFSLLGSGMGCLSVIFVIPLFSNAGAIIFAALVLLVAALFFNSNRSMKVSVSLLPVIAILIIVLINARSLFEFKVADSKALSDFQSAGLKPALTKWNAFSRIDVFKPSNAIYAPGLSSKYPLTSIPPQMMMFIDADAITPITEIKKDASSLDFVNYLPSSMAYHLRPRSRACVVGAGGGYDVLTALSAGAAELVTAVEINADIGSIVKDEFKEFAGNIYSLQAVDLQIEEGRSFVRNSSETFDVIQISLVDTCAAASSGAYSLAENYLYTTEAFTDYMNHLAPNGIFTVTRWLLTPPKECLRLASLALASLEKIGAPNPQNNIVFVGSGRVAVLLLKRSEFSQAEVKEIQRLCEKYGFNLLYAPRIAGDNIFHKFIHLKNRNVFYSIYPLNVEPPTDDKPFYFHYYTWDKIRFSKSQDLLAIYRHDISYLILIVVLVMALFLSAVFIVAPLAMVKKAGISKCPLCYRFMLYFACLGMGFMFIEVTLIQKFILFLGHPVYSLSVVLSSLLVFAGLGSLYTVRFSHGAVTRKLSVILGSLVTLVLIYSYVLTKLSYLFLGWDLTARFAVSALLLAPLGFLMGMPFPIGIRLADGTDTKLVPWSWAVNGCLSVVSSVLSVIIALSFGFSVVLRCAAVVYLLAMLVMQRGPRLSLGQGSSEVV